MADDPVQDYRRERFSALINAAPYSGNLAKLGRALGYKDGVYVRQMRDAERPISEKTVAKIEALEGRAGWFGSTREALQLSARAIAIGAFFDRASPEVRAIMDRMVPVDIDLTQPNLPHQGGVNTGLGDLDPLGKEADK